VAGAHQGDRPAASLYPVGDRFQLLSFTDRLFFHTSKYAQRTGDMPLDDDQARHLPLIGPKALRQMQANRQGRAMRSSATAPQRRHARWRWLSPTRSSYLDLGDEEQRTRAAQEPERIGAALYERFNRSYAEGALITPERSAAALIGCLSGDDTGAIWDVSAAPVRS
jgi:hypothetical protein